MVNWRAKAFIHFLAGLLAGTLGGIYTILLIVIWVFYQYFIDVAILKDKPPTWENIDFITGFIIGRVILGAYMELTGCAPIIP